MLIGPSDEQWDEIILVLYPRRSSFERMLERPEYQASAQLRVAALQDSRLIAATAPQTIGRIARTLYKLTSRRDRRSP
jgi:hypothetical protein